MYDPDASLAAIRAAMTAMGRRKIGDRGYRDDLLDDLLDIAAHADLLDMWLTVRLDADGQPVPGGYLPDAWAVGRATPPRLESTEQLVRHGIRGRIARIVAGR